MSKRKIHLFKVRPNLGYRVLTKCGREIYIGEAAIAQLAIPATGAVTGMSGAGESDVTRHATLVTCRRCLEAAVS